MNIIIDGKHCECEKGEFILQIARRNNIYIPTLCHSDALSGIGSCRLCMVEVIDRGRSKVVTACLFPVAKEVEVVTNSDKIKRIRKNVVMLLKARCPENKEIDDLAKYFDVDEHRVQRFKLDKTENCVLCGLCTRACNKLGAGAISTVNRGIYKDVSTPYNEISPECIGCESCANVCPTNAIKVTKKDNELEIWGKKFKMIKCSACGRYFATEEHIKFAYKKAGMKLDLNKVMCDKCKREKSSKQIAKIYKDYNI